MKSQKDIIYQLFNDLNSQNIKNFEDYFAVDARLSVFTVNKGDYTEIQGIDKIIETLRINFENSDVEIQIQKIISENDNCAISGHFVGTRFFTIHLNEDETFKIKFMAFFEFKDGKIISFDYSSNTFEAMRLSGIATIKLGDKEQIMKYLSVLKNSGIIPDKMILQH